jgi:formylglycine-generating enzyme required for sulfatase activity
MEPGFTSSVFNYTVFVSKDTDRFTVNANLNGTGTIEIMCEEDQETGTEFDYLDDEKVVILTAEREYMDVAQYRITVIREETVPTATGVDISVTPGIGAFFIGRGVLPEFRVTAKPPSAGGVLSYQWYVNTENSNRGGTRINGATGTTYKMKSYETVIAGTAYYYAEVTNTIDGKTGITESNPCRVTFVDINDLDEKSRGTMVNIPAGNVTQDIIDVAWFSQSPGYPTPPPLQPWSTPGFSMGKYLVTYELWKTVFDYADAGGYRFPNVGNAGGEDGNMSVSIGNDLHPVCWISYRDAIVWCNAYSEMDGREPVYRDSDGNVLRDSRVKADELIDKSQMTGKNGYRLPTREEWAYAWRGANPSTSAPWTNKYPGTNEDDEANDYVLNLNIGSGYVPAIQTAEVGTLLPNSIGLFDMSGMFYTLLHDIYIGFLHQSQLYIRLAIGESNYKYYDGSTIGGAEGYQGTNPYTMRVVLDKE